MTDDPDELMMEKELARKDPVRIIAELRDVLNDTEIHLRYGIPRITLIGWLIIALLSLILWRIW